MTGSIWFVGDLHFRHEKISQIRGFGIDFHNHDNHIIDQWKSTVKPEDIVYVMGDISPGGHFAERYALAYLMNLPGRKRLILGNHDSESGIHRQKGKNTDFFREVFESINEYGRIRVEGRQILLSHYPYWASKDGPGRGEGRYEQFRLPDLGAPLIHAHTHHTHPTDGSATGRELCVSWDAWGRLVGMADIQKWVKSLDN